MKISISGELLDNELWYSLGFVAYCWKIILMSPNIYFPGITLEQISAGYRNVVDEVEDWQLEFASYIERMGELSESTLTHCKVNLSHDPSTFTV